jgi:erythronate-4-phosphate dehydrogenase
MKILADENIVFVHEAFAEFGEVVAVPGREIGPGNAAGAGMLLVRSITRVDRALLEKSAVRFVGTATIGIDHVDVPYLAGRNIGFASAPGSNATAVAEYVMSAILHWTKGKGISLPDLRMGIVGVGNVGSRVVRLARALGMSCLLNDPPKKRQTGDPAFIDLDSLLADADIVTLHVPLTLKGEDATAHMVDRGFIDRMKEGAVLINTSRGGVVDEQALRKNRGRLGGFIADVWENEPRISTDSLACADIATPHIAGYSFEGKVRGTAMVHEAACGFFGHVPRWNAAGSSEASATKPLDLKDGCDTAFEAVTKAYPIMDDDARMRALASVPATQRGSYFDMLRKEYPVRHEFAHYLIPGQANGATREELEGLGFTVG